MIAGARQAGLNVSKTADLFRNHSQQSLKFPQNGTIKKRAPVSGSSVDANALLIREVTEEWPDWFELTESLP